jgi:protein ImuB
VDRLACVNVTALPLQILLRDHPKWADLPVAVVQEDKPQAFVLYLNARARRTGVRLGQRYAVALTFARDLQAAAISPSQIAESVHALADRLRRFSPNVEPASDMPGVFWLDVQGLERLHPSLSVWAEAVRADLHGARMKASVAVGFSRFGAYALAMSHRGVLVCESAAEEHEKVQRVPLGRLNLPPETRESLRKLGISTVGDFLHLPGDGIKMRFGAEVDSLYQLAAGYRWAPLLPFPADEVHENFVNFDAPESNAERLIFTIKRLLDELVATLDRHLAIAEIVLQMKLDDRTARIERVRAAAPTRDMPQLLALIYIRINAIQLSAGIITLRVTAGTCAVTADQRQLFQERRRDAEAANQALAKIRAECGERGVVYARLCNAHLPNARFVWEPMAQVPALSKPSFIALRPLVRRIYTKPLPLPEHFPAIDAPENRASGPYVLSGGWWAKGVTERDYYFFESSGHLWWAYYDRRRKQFFTQGRVE